MTDALDRMRAESDWLKAELTLRAEIDRLQKEIGRLRDDYANRLLDICADSRRFMDERDAAIKQRDEARQLYCGAVEKIQHGITNETKRSVADFLGWDCFKEDGKKDVNKNGNP